MREMLESNIGYINKMPKDWQLVPGKSMFSEVKDKNTDGLETNALKFTYGEIVRKENFDATAEEYVANTIKTYNRVRPDDVVINCLNLNYDFISQRVGIVRENGVITSAYLVLRPDAHIDPKYLNYLLKSCDNMKVFHGMGEGVRQTIKFDDLGYMTLPCSLLSEQRAIVAYLDEKCSAIDEAIERHKKIIEKLEEYRKAVVSDAIVHGLDKCVSVKASGISGIGDIPTHFSSTRVKFLGTYRNGLTYSPADVCNSDEGILVLRSSNIQDGKLTLDDNVYVNCPIDERIMVKDGDILICARNGSAKLVGKSAIIEGVHATYGAFMMVLRTTEVPKYMYYMLNSVVMDVYRASFSTTTVNQLTAGILGNMVIPYCPDKVEQRAIADYLDEKCAAINDVIESHQGIVNKLEEYRKSIIYNAVTGKIDCRKAVK